MRFFFISIAMVVTLAFLFGGIEFSREVNKVKLLGFCPVPHQSGGDGYYSQFYEDYILSIIFQNKGSGRYVDVGAHDPSNFSLTKHFYKQGWSGINIEPIPELHKKYLKERPRDINENVGISNQEEVMKFYVASDDQLSTGNLEYAKKMIEKGFGYRVREIQVTTLDNLLEKHSISEIDFLKIDVEGMEKEVLEGINLSKYKPSLIVIESVVPFTHDRTYTGWEKLLSQNNYRFAYFDELNSYYILEEHYPKYISNVKKAKYCHKLALNIHPETHLANYFKNEVDYKVATSTNNTFQLANMIKNYLK